MAAQEPRSQVCEVPLEQAVSTAGSQPRLPLLSGRLMEVPEVLGDIPSLRFCCPLPRSASSLSLLAEHGVVPVSSECQHLFPTKIVSRLVKWSAIPFEDYAVGTTQRPRPPQLLQQPLTPPFASPPGAALH